MNTKASTTKSEADRAPPGPAAGAPARLRILLVDHIAHQKTGSFTFFRELLAKRHEVDVFYYERPYRMRLPKERIARADCIVYWEFLPGRFQVGESGKRCVFVPMYDNEWNSVWQWRRLARLGMRVISFCGKLTRHAVACGMHDALDVRFALPPDDTPSAAGNPRIAALWERGDVTASTLALLLSPGLFNKILLFRRPGNTPLSPLSPSFLQEYHIELHDSDYLPEEEYKALLREPGVYIAPRFKEGIGMSFLEALAMGKFVIAHKDATMDEAIEPGVNGLLVDMRHPPHLDTLPHGNTTRARELRHNRYGSWLADEQRILDFFDSLPSLPPLRSPWSLFSLIAFPLYLAEGLFMRWKQRTNP